MSLFQGILIGVFIVAIIGGVILFGIVQQNDEGALSAVTMWGTISPDTMTKLFNNIYSNENATIPKITYIYHPKETFERDFLEALALGTGPDLVLIPHEDIFKQSNKLYTIPYKSFPERTFKDMFVEEGEIFLNDEGVLAVPYVIDPLVMYWNRTLFTKAGISAPPNYWDEFIQIVPRLSEKDSAGNLRRSGAALGEFVNIDYAKDILSMLLIQSGSPIVGKKESMFQAFLDERGSFTVTPTDTAITFFVQFANPVKTLYSWSRSLPNSIEAFSEGDVAMMFGKASDLTRIQIKNPNLNFDVTEVPEPRGTDAGKTTFGSMYGLAVVRNSDRISSAISAIYELSSKEYISIWSSITNLPPTRRDLLVEDPADSYKDVFYKAAVRSRGWFDPDKDQTYGIFKTMIDTIVTGKEGGTSAIKEADDQLNELLNQYQPQKKTQ